MSDYPKQKIEAAVWSYWRQLEGDYRIRESIDGGRNHRIIGYVATEESAKRICDAINQSSPPKASD